MQNYSKTCQALLVGAGLFLSAPAVAFADCDPGTEVTGRQVDPAWGERTITLLEGDVTRVFAMSAKHCGNIKHQDLLGQWPWAGWNRNRYRAYGFSNTTTDKLVFSVEVPAGKAGAYNAELVFDNGGLNAGNVFSITGDGSSSVYVDAELSDIHVRQADYSYSRPATTSTISLVAGVNEIEVKLDTITSQQTSLGQAATTTNVSGIRLIALELTKQSDRAALVAQARQVPGEMDWVAENGRWGLFVHHSPYATRAFYGGTHVGGGSYSAGTLLRDEWDQFVTDFDVVAFADKAEEAGASYVVFTVFHGYPFFPGPSPVLDSLYPGHTASRDLIKDLGNELESRGMRLGFYFHPGKDDDNYLQALGYYNFADRQIFNENLISLQEEWAKRYNGTGGYPKLLSTALYMDAMWQGFVQNDFPWKEYIDRVKAPDALPDSIMGISMQTHISPTILNDVHIADSGNQAAIHHASIFDNYEGNDPNDTMLGIGAGHPFRLENLWYYGSSNASWSGHDPIHTIDEVVASVAHGTGMSGPVFINLKMSADVRDNVPFLNPVSVDFMNSVSAELLDIKRPYIIDNSRYDALTYAGEWDAVVDADAYGASVQSISGMGSGVSATFKGNSVKAFMKGNNQYGGFEVLIDGASRGTFTSSGPTNASSEVFRADSLSDGAHTIEIVSIGSNELLFDYFETEENEVVVSPSGVVTDDANKTALNYSGSGWTHKFRDESLDDTISYTKTAGDAAEYAFTGDTFRFFTQKGPGAGIVELYIDNVLVQTIDTYSASAVHGALVAPQTGLGEGTHTAKIVCTGNKNPSAINSWCHVDRMTSHINSVGTTKVDDAALGELRYSAGWTHQARAESLNDTISHTNQAGQTAEMAFNGTGVTIRGQKSKGAGIIDIYIDELKVATVDTYSPTTGGEHGQIYFEKLNLVDAIHTLRIECTGEKNPSATNRHCHLDEVEVHE